MEGEGSIVRDRWIRRGKEIDGVEERDLEQVREESETGDDGESMSENIRGREKKRVSRWRNRMEWG